jgi:uncharacterized membrane protein (DUF373 family)
MAHTAGAVVARIRSLTKPPDPAAVEKIASVFERLAVSALMLLLMATILFGTVVTAWSLVEDLGQVHELVAEPKVLFDTFGLFVAILVGVELLKILRHLLQAHEVDTALVVQTALMALCNKVITANLSNMDGTKLGAVAALIAALAAALYALRRTASAHAPDHDSAAAG